MKPLLYIDVDDTIIAQIHQGSGYDLRPNVMTQLHVLAKLFDCRWLTYWPAEEITSLMGNLYGHQINSSIHWIDWQANDLTNKAVTVVAGRPDFWWLENPLLDEERLLLARAGVQDRYIEVEPTGPDGFARGCRQLFERIGITDQDLRRVGGKMSWFADTHHLVHAVL